MSVICTCGSRAHEPYQHDAMVRYAVYILVVEDTEENDQDLALRCESMERADGGLSIAEAEDLASDLAYEARHRGDL